MARRVLILYWHPSGLPTRAATMLVQALTLRVEINAVVPKPESSTMLPVAAGIETAEPFPGS